MGKRQWFGMVRWSAEDAVAAAEEKGVVLTKAQAAAWWKENERRFREEMLNYGWQFLLDTDFRKPITNEVTKQEVF